MYRFAGQYVIVLLLTPIKKKVRLMLKKLQCKIVGLFQEAKDWLLLIFWCVVIYV